MLRNHKQRRFVYCLSSALVVAGTMLVDWRLLRRAATYPDAPIMAVDWYEPKALVRGQQREPLPTATEPLPPEFAAALKQVSDYTAARNSTGLLVMHQGEIVWEKYWQGHDANSPFNAMSMSKTIAGLLVGIAIEEGAIASTDDLASQYLPEWQQDDRRAISLQDLLYMQSGLRNERHTDTPTSDLVQMYVGSDVASTALNIPLAIPPGQTFEYNNVNTQIIALILQRATGLAYPEYLAAHLWQPLGAQDASIWLDRPQGTAKTFCCLFATIHDWARVGQLLLNQGQVGNTQVVPAEWIQTMLTPSPLEPTFGHHIWVKARTTDYLNVDQASTEPFVAEDTFYLDGRGLQRVYVIPSQALVVVRMGENPDTWDDAVIPNTLVTALMKMPR
ncbi:MAG: serine hydrolase [Cyanobacteria bacterium J06638_28]